MATQNKQVKRQSNGRREMLPFRTVRDLFGSPPNLPGESYSDFWRFWEHTREHMRPEDPIEEIFVRDLAECHFELRRLKRFKLSFLADKEAEGMERILTGRLDEPKIQAAKWRRQDDAAFKQIHAVMNDFELTRGDAQAIAMSMNMDMLGAFDVRISIAQSRLTTVIREMDGHRAQLARLAKLLPEDDADRSLPGESGREAAE